MAPRRPKTTEVPAAGHNADAVDEADRVQLISIIGQLSAADEEIEAAKGPLKAAQAKRKRIIGLGKAAGFAAKELAARLEEMKEDSREQEERIARETKHRRWLGILRPDQPTLNLDGNTPEEVRDEAHWKSEGYKAGLRRLPAKPPEGIPQRFVQAWLGERARGAAEVPADHGEPEKSVADRAREDFVRDNPTGEEFASLDELEAQKPRLAVVEGRSTEDVT